MLCTCFQSPFFKVHQCPNWTLFVASRCLFHPLSTGLIINIIFPLLHFLSCIFFFQPFILTMPCNLLYIFLSIYFSSSSRLTSSLFSSYSFHLFCLDRKGQTLYLLFIWSQMSWNIKHSTSMLFRKLCIEVKSWVLYNYWYNTTN